MSLSVIIVSHNTKALLAQCLQSVVTQPIKDLQIIVIDNGSSDGSVPMISSQFPGVKLIINSQNLGFARANNQGIDIADGNYLLLLNSDTVLHSDSLNSLIKFMDSHRSVGICSPQLRNQDGTIQPNGGALPRLSNIAFWMLFLDDLPVIKNLITPYQQRHAKFFTDTRSIGWVAGTAMMIRKKVIHQIGKLDDQIFMYGEDTDFCIRARHHGWRIYTIHSAQVTHFGHGSGSARHAILGEFKGLVYLFSKHKPAWELTVLRVLLKTGALLRVIIFGKILRNSRKYEIYTQALKLV